MKTGTVDAPYLRRYGMEDGYRRIAELGFECIDCQSFVNTETPLFAANAADFEAELKRRKNVCSQNGLTISQTHGPWRCPIQDDTPENRNERFEKMSRSLLGTALLGSDKMVLHPIMPFGADEGLHTQEVWKLNFDFYARLCKVAQTYGVTICLENMPFRCQSTSTPESILRLVRTIDAPNCKVCLDTGHCLVMGLQPAVALRQIGREHLACLHIHDNNGEGDYHWPPFTGKCDWTAFRSTLHDIGYTGVLSLETNVPNGLPDELAPLQEQSLAQMAKWLAT